MGMYFYEVLVNSQRYHGQEPLTYSCDKALKPGIVVMVPFGNQKVSGIITQPVPEPAFETKAITTVLSETPLPAPILELHQWFTDYYPGPLGFITQLFLTASLQVTSRNSVQTLKQANGKQAVLPKLHDEQAQAVQTVLTAEGPFLLHGETGSGKTRVYQEITQQTLKNGRSAIVLTPEIGLTPQLVKDFETAFPGQVVTVHSEQTQAARRENWKQIIAADTPLVVIGPRSALFSPVSNLGLIIIDEAHDTAYKQEQMPYYQTTRAAGKLAELSGAKLILGTATPSVQDYYVFKQKNLPIIEMKSAAVATHTKTVTELIDLKDRRDFSRSPWLSDSLISAMESALAAKTQALIFLNRRGTARLVLCQNCGWQALCPRCDLPLTYHGDSHHLRCHTCGFTDSAPSFCPECNGTDISFKSVGTKTIVSEIARLFPKAAIGRFDSDVHKNESLESKYSAVKSGELDILVGTQMLIKGLDLPKLTVVGVVAADTNLYFPDYSAEERTFQMLRQVIGRVGRGYSDGAVFIQTYHPENPTLTAAINRDYEQFYDAQIAERELYRFPPFYFLLKITVQRAVQSSAKAAAQELTQKLLQQGLRIEINGPSPAFVEKQHNRYRWQIVVKSKQRSELVKIIQSLPKNCLYDIDPTNLL